MILNNNINEDGIWVIGDVHGEFDKLVNLIDKLPFAANICFTGDLVDRGEKSAEVVELIIKNNYDCVLGNHEQMMIEALDEGEFLDGWKMNGGNKTADSYLKYPDKKLTEHLDFMSKLPYFLYYEFEAHKPLVVSHSYIHHIWYHKDYQYSKDTSEDILHRHMHSKKLFDRSKELLSGVYNIFGHSVTEETRITDTYAMIDTGAAYSHQKGYGKLTAIHYPSLQIIKSVI
jgi:serine/threonine protein phosphatase 1